jgi:glutathione synthase/RimK-type ligase-like ATP-grasp enzyme
MSMGYPTEIGILAASHTKKETGSMIHALIRHKVKDYDEWKKHFDADAVHRKPGGSKGGHVFRSKNDPNEVYILMEMDSMEKAEKFILSEQLKKTMKEAGVVGKPDIVFLDDGEKFKN